MKTKRELIKNRVQIDDRPEAINNRSEFGHWEGDTIYSHRGDKTVFLTSQERLSRYLLANKLSNRKAHRIGNILSQATENYKIKSITLDNGTEFIRHEQIGCQVYFCHPYSSWEKGGIEYANRLIRRYCPKKSKLKDYSYQYLQKTVMQINNTPRKCLNFRTPQEVFFAHLEKLP